MTWRKEQGFDSMVDFKTKFISIQILVTKLLGWSSYKWSHITKLKSQKEIYSTVKLSCILLGAFEDAVNYIQVCSFKIKVEYYFNLDPNFQFGSLIIKLVEITFSLSSINLLKYF